MNRYAAMVVNFVRWAVCIMLIWKAVNMPSNPPTFKTAEEAQWYLVRCLLVGGSVFAWMLFTLYLFPDQHTKEDGLSRWLDTKIGREWRRT